MERGMSGVFGEEWRAAKKELNRYWMHRCDGDVLLENISGLRNEMMASIHFDSLRRQLLHMTMTGAVLRANRMMGWWWEE